MAWEIGRRRECFFDGELLCEDETTAEFRLHEPVLRETVLTHDAPWEGSGCDYHNLFFDETWPGVDGAHPEGTYRMYYLGWQCPTGAPDEPQPGKVVVCYAESPDGLSWTKPSLGLCEFDGSRDNNILLGREDKNYFDNFMVFRDDAPGCPADERYKGVAAYCEHTGRPPVLCAYFSADGIRFRLGPVITEQGVFDTLNVVFWDEQAGLYRGYIRGFHDALEDGSVRDTERIEYGKRALNEKVNIRDIRYLESKDFRTWTEPVLLDFEGAEDVPLYTNVVSPYCRAPHLLIGFPTRYVERSGWNSSFEELGGREARRLRMTLSQRYGLTVTDCLFMCSRDGRRFHRFDEAFLRPGPENGRNWVYGDCYPARGLVETPAPVPGAPNELSMYLTDNHFSAFPAHLQRYALRLDGFVSLHAGGAERKIVTKPFRYEGSRLYLNFATAAWGWLTVTLRCGGEEAVSDEVFGDTVDRRVGFSGRTPAAFAGREVVMEIRMRDADVYSFRFGD
ncbi:MAG: hypothetical protein IJL69_00785 [Oscillospiraceae bacterium]|nr:hypothetical protein [Oscillospiraceae bacterium]